MAAFDVLLPVRNGIDYLGEAIESIAAQSFGDWRLFVLDHGSHDGSVELAARYRERDSRIVVCSFPEASGLADLLNRGLALCDANYVLRQDADDVSMPHRMEVLAGAFADDPALVLAGSRGDVIDASGARIGAIDVPAGPAAIAAQALFITPMSHPTVAMRLDALHRLGARYGNDFLGVLPVSGRLQVSGLAEDYFLFAQLAFSVKCTNVEKALVSYRWHGANTGGTRYVEQMQTALRISRYMARTMAVASGTECFDPAPFCNHGECLFDVHELAAVPMHYERLARLLRRLVPAGADLERELAFREVVSHRRRARMAAAFCGYAARFAVSTTQRRTVSSWLLRGIKRRRPLKIQVEGWGAC
jgi:glycosyltransferase involved in cell wall biosynthesis